MSALIWLRPVLSCCLVWNSAGGELQPISTTGGQDKRAGAHGRYGIVVVDVFACCALDRSATGALINLISFIFFRPTPSFREVSA
ncbi:hypothetical protein [Rhodovulum sp. P5]|uniref:hypothetical protein n=1 Tax=Rhodovulum sp. P5 TaxID=1564506 RepID=UPI0012EC3254|nr:hypothetical protein [Rhodovulum sp. P5]